MSEREEVIEIERNENIVIEVNEPGECVATATQISVLAKWKRVIIGTGLILLLIVPVVGGALSSYFLRRDLHSPTDPYNVWPDTEYRDPNAPAYQETFDKGYSTEPNDHFLINNGNLNYFTVKNGAQPEMYFSLYMVENLFASRDIYGLHIVSSTDKDNLSPLRNISSARYSSDLSSGMQHSGSYNGWSYYHTGPHGADLANNLAETLEYKFSPDKLTSQDQVIDYIAKDIVDSITSKSSKFYYPTDSKSGTYLASKYYGCGIEIPLFKKLYKMRCEKRELEEEKRSKGSKTTSGKGSTTPEKPKFKRIKMLSLTEVSA